MKVMRDEKAWKPIVIVLGDKQEALELYSELCQFDFSLCPNINKLMTMLDEEF